MVTLQSLVKLLAYLEARKNACTKEEGGIYSLGGRGSSRAPACGNYCANDADILCIELSTVSLSDNPL